jgi:hypothetical protein
VSDSVPFIFTVGDPKGAIAGLDEAIREMKSGGTRDTAKVQEVLIICLFQDLKSN